MMRMIQRFLLFMLLVALVSLPSAPVISQSPANNDASRVFGIVEGYWRPEAATELGVSWDRISFDWARIQPDGPGEFGQNIVRSEWITQSIENGRDVVGLIINTPSWASASGLPSAVPDGLYRPFDSPENYWAVFIRQIAEIYAPLGIHRWIIWDKPDIQASDLGQAHTFDGTAENYYRLVKVAHAQFSAVDPDAEVFLGGLVWWNDIALERANFLSEFLAFALNDPSANGNNFYFEGVSLNLSIWPNAAYGLNNNTDSIGNIASTVRQQLNEAGLSDKRIWISSLNAPPTLDAFGGLSDSSIGISLEQQVDFLVQSSATALGTGVERMAVFKLFDANFDSGKSIPFGLIRADNSRRPAFEAYAYAIETFSPTLSASAGRSQNARLVVLNQPTRTVFVMWSAETQPVNFWIEAAFGDQFALTDALGNPLAAPRLGVGPDNITVHVIETPPAIPDQSGAILVSGSPRIFILESSSPRSVWASLGDARGVKLH